MQTDMQADARAQVDALVQIRRDIHAHPELAFEEHRTAALVQQYLCQWGLEVHAGIGQTGVVGVLRCGSSGRSIGLRADMDALPVQEDNTFAHASVHPGRMHACGHDGHTAILLGAAWQLAQQVQQARAAGGPGPFDGVVYFIFQPAEEAGGGARVMMDDGLFDRFDADAVYGLHNWPGLAAGDVAVSAGPVMASSSDFCITLHGQGGHAAMPHQATDPIPVACQLVQAFQTIVSRNTRPLDAAVVSVTMLRAGDVSNIIPTSCTLQGTVRTFSLEVLDMVEQRMAELTRHISTAFGLRADFQFDREYPPTINHPAQAGLLRQVASQVLGAQRVHAQEPTMGAEDFGYMLQRKPGCYFFLGNGEGSHRHSGHGLGACQLHNPSYDFNDQLIATGVALWTALVQQALAPAAQPIHSDSSSAL